MDIPRLIAALRAYEIQQAQGKDTAQAVTALRTVVAGPAVPFGMAVDDSEGFFTTQVTIYVEPR